MLNTQRPEPQSLMAGSLDLHSMFYTLQGEGPHTGRRALFVRLAGCNLQCPACDTEYTDGRRRLTFSPIIAEMRQILAEQPSHDPRRQLVVITGGEPLRQELGPFVQRLIEGGEFMVQIESNGVFAPDPILADFLETIPHIVQLVVSPKTSRIHPDCHRMATAFKYVLSADSINPVDGLPISALGHKVNANGVARPSAAFQGRIYINPADAKDPEINAANCRAVAQSALKFGYIAGVQLHKILDLA